MGSNPNKLKSEKLDDSVTIERRGRTLVMHQLFESEIKTLGSSGLQLSLHLTLFGISIGVACSFWTTWLLVRIADPYVYASFLMIAILATFLTCYFGSRSVIGYIEKQKQINEIMDSDGILSSKIIE